MSITHPHHVPTINIPAWKNWFSERLSRLEIWRKQRRQRRIDRLAFQQMLYLDDHMLEDVGYHRADLEGVNNLPLDVNAAAAVRMLREAQRRQPTLRRRP